MTDVNMRSGKATITHGMVLAAGLGERMRPLTDNMPKPLLKIAGRSLLDHALDRLETAGVTHAVVNTFYLTDMISDHVAGRTSPEIGLSREDVRLETGGGILNALPMLGEGAFYAVNGDAFWLNGPTDALLRMADIWDEKTMDALLLLHSTVDAYGYSGLGDFVAEPGGRLARRPEQIVSPFLFTGIQILHSRLFQHAPQGVFSLNLLYDQAIENDRLYGIVHDGEWFHIGTPKGLADAESFMEKRFAGRQRR